MVIKYCLLLCGEYYTNSSNNIPVSIEIDVDGNVHTITNPEDIANAFNSHYTTVAEKFSKNANIMAINPIKAISKIQIHFRL